MFLMKAYLRFTGLRFEARDCAWGSFAPTGQIPAIDNQAELLLGCEDSESIAQELEGARKIIDHLEIKAETSLDNLLAPGERAIAKAFSSLIESKLIPGLLYSAFCEPDAFAKATRPALGSKLPFPLNYWLPYSSQKRVKKLLSFRQGKDIYEDACQALHAIACKLEDHKAYFLGNKISSVGEKPCDMIPSRKLINISVSETSLKGNYMLPLQMPVFSPPWLTFIPRLLFTHYCERITRSIPVLLSL